MLIEEWQALDSYNQGYTFIDFLDADYYENRCGLFITLEKNTKPQEKIVILFPDRIIVSCSVIYEPLSTYYRKIVQRKSKKVSGYRIALFSQSPSLYVFRQENLISDGKDEECVVYLPIRDVVVEVLALRKPFLMVCLGDKIEYEYTTTP